MKRITKIIKYLPLVLVCMLLFGCQIKKKLTTYNNSYYTVAIYKMHAKPINNNVTINIKALNGKPLNNLIYWVKRDCENVRIDNSSTYSLKVAYETLRMEVTGFGYRTIEIKPLNLTAKDSVVFDFYLTPDDRPLLECITNSSNN
ncbi:hypothetical protein [Flavobacterium sandaracinum]|uniref:Lipoprotein n=1 Tax=Flavobacterium sandaracinum TaxID=2541733 RepID=A0A4V2Z0B6_9FLAO|nr:hypothetical protein [Flavobacterium sandaracinum]TDE00388.1 hypothetical protein E0F91_16590 [Flavobacterium sandaracinum]